MGTDTTDRQTDPPTERQHLHFLGSFRSQKGEDHFVIYIFHSKLEYRIAGWLAISNQG